MLRQHCRRIRAHLAQDGVDETGIALRPARLLRLLDGKADGGVWRHLHEGELCRARDQKEPRLEGIGGQRLLQKAAKQILDLPQPPQSRRGDGVRKGAVSGFEAREGGFRARAGENLVEWLTLAQDRAQQIGGKPASLQARVLSLRLFLCRFQWDAA